MFERAGESAFNYTLHGAPEDTSIQWHFFEQTSLPVAVQTWRLPPGGVEGMHAHPAEEPLEELYLVVGGRARMTVDARTHDLGPGDAVLAPVGTEHDVRNTGDTELTMVVVWGRPAPADWSAYGTAKAASAARGAPAHD